MTVKSFMIQVPGLTNLYIYIGLDIEIQQTLLELFL